MNNNNYYLMHHGIKGQQWGVRRYQNEDGSLKSAGKARYKFSGNTRKEPPKQFGPKDDRTGHINNFGGNNPTARRAPGTMFNNNPVATRIPKSSDSNGYYHDFYKKDDRNYRIASSLSDSLTDYAAYRHESKDIGETPRKNIVNSDKARDYYTGASTACKTYLDAYKRDLKNKAPNMEPVTSTKPQDYIINGGVWSYNYSTNVNEYSKTPPKVYGADEIPKAYRDAVDDVIIVDDEPIRKEIYDDVKNGKYLVTDEMITSLENSAKQYADNYELNIRGAITFMPDYSSGKKENYTRDINSIALNYGKAVLNGNNAIYLQQQANALKDAQKQQRSNPVLYTKALVNEVKETVSNAFESSPLNNKAKNFIKGLFGK